LEFLKTVCELNDEIVNKYKKSYPNIHFTKNWNEILNDKSIAYSYLKSAKAGDKSDVLQSIEKYLDKILEKFTPSKDFQLTRNNLQAVFNATKFEHNF